MIWGSSIQLKIMIRVLLPIETWGFASRHSHFTFCSLRERFFFQAFEDAEVLLPSDPNTFSSRTQMVFLNFKFLALVFILRQHEHKAGDWLL